MNFHAPYFLFGLIALGIPILIHLIDLIKPESRVFSNVDFLKFSISKQQSNTKVKYWLILLSRILTFVFLVLAFSQPYLKDSFKSQHANNAIRQIHIDNSMSMQQELHQISGLDEAKRMAQELIYQQSLNAKFQLSTQDFTSNDWLVLDRNKMLTSIGDIPFTNQSVSASQIMNRLQGMSNQTFREVFIISDFQKKQWEGISSAIEKDSSTFYHLLPIETNSFFNIAIDSIWVDPIAVLPGQSQKIYYRIKSYGKGEKNIPVSIHINGTQQGLQNIHFKNEQSVEGQFEVNVPNEQLQLSGEIRIDDSPVSFDNTFYFTLPTFNPSEVYLISDNERSSLHALYSNTSLFHYYHSSSKNINYSLLNQAQLIIIESSTTFNTELSKYITQLVQTKKTPLVLLPSTNQATDYIRFLQQMGIQATVSSDYVDTSKANYLIKVPSKKQTFFKDILLDEPQSDAYMPYAQPMVVVQATYQTLLENIRNTPFLIKIKNNQLPIYTFTCPLNMDYTNLSKHNLFLPIFYKFVFENKYGDNLLYMRLNDKKPSEWMLNKRISTLNPKVILSKDSKNWILNTPIQNNKINIELPLDVNTPGIYNLYINDTLTNKIAINHSTIESFSERMDVSTLEKQIEALKNVDILNLNSNKSIDSMKIHEEGKSLWKYCVILAFIFILLETLLLRLNKK